MIITIIIRLRSANLVQKLIVVQMTNVHDSVHKNPILSSTNPICAVVIYLIKIQLNIVALAQSVPITVAVRVV
jgi:hypothetical protein